MYACRYAYTHSKNYTLHGPRPGPGPRLAGGCHGHGPGPARQPPAEHVGPARAWAHIRYSFLDVYMHISMHICDYIQSISSYMDMCIHFPFIYTLFYAYLLAYMRERPSRAQSQRNY